MRGRAAVLVLSLSSFLFPLSSSGQCSWTPRASAQFRTTALDVSADGTLLWLATGYGVQLLDGSGTRVADSVALPGSTRVVRADGRGVAYAGSGSRLYVLQRDRAKISIVRFIDLGAGATIHDILIAGSSLFVAASNGLAHYDVIQPADPIRTSVVLPTSSPNVTSLAVSWPRLYAADGDDTIDVFDISVPSLPQRTGELATMTRATAVHASGDTLLVSDAFGQNTDVFAGATRVGRLPVGANAAAAAGNGVHFVAGPDRTLRAVDFTSLSTLKELFEHQLAPRGGTDNVIHAMVRSGQTLYVAAGDIGLVVYDVSQFQPPYAIVSYRTSATTSTVVSGDRAWFSDAGGTIAEQRIDMVGLDLTTVRTWSGGTLVHDAEGTTLLASSNDTATLWSNQTAVSTSKFPAAVKSAAIRGNDVVALLADGTVWLGGETPRQVALPKIAALARAGNAYLFVETRDEGKTVLHYYPSSDFTAEPRRVTLDGAAIGNAALDATRAAVFTFRGVNVVDLASGAVRVIADSNRVIPRQLVFSGDVLLVLDTRVLYVYHDARTLIREHFLPADAVMLGAQGNRAVMATAEGTLAASYLAAQPTARLPFSSSFYTKVVTGRDRIYLLGPDGVDIQMPSLRWVAGIKAGGIIDVAATADALFTLNASGVVTAYSRFGVPFAQMTIGEGSDAQPLAIDTAGNAVWVSLSKGCLTGGCQKKTLVLDPASLAVTSSINGGVVDVVTGGTRAYALFDLPSEIRVLDIADPLRPAQVIASAAPASATSVAAHSGRVFVAGDRLYEFTESTLLPKAAHLAAVTPDKAQQVRVDGNCLVLAARGANPETYNAATLAPAAGSFEVPSGVRGIAVEAGTIFLLTGHSLEVWSSAAPVPGKRKAVR